jgi:epsilon-lactone hydrolase
MKTGSFPLLALAAAFAVPGIALAQLQQGGPRHVPAKVLAVPTDVSPEMQEIIARSLNPDWNDQWKTGEEARRYADKRAVAVVKTIPALLERMHVKMEASNMDGVRVHVITPDEIPGRNRNRVLVHLHGGCYVLFPGKSGTTEAIIMAGFGHFTVIAVDYRMPPEGYFPAALDDALTVYKAVIKDANPKNVGIFGNSAGGALTLEMVLKAKQDGLPMPGAISAGTPMADATRTGDSFYTNEKVDNVLVSPNGFCHAATLIYAHGHNLHDPLLSPVYGDMHGFPPTILTTGTRDLLLSNTVRVHRKLRELGIDAALNVFEAQSHAQYQLDDRVPETKEAFSEIAEFFNAHLGK